MQSVREQLEKTFREAKIAMDECRAKSAAIKEAAAKARAKLEMAKADLIELRAVVEKALRRRF